MTEIVDAVIVEESPGFRVEQKAISPPPRHAKPEDGSPGTGDSSLGTQFQNDDEDIEIPDSGRHEKPEPARPENIRRPRGRPPGSGKKIPPAKETPKEAPKLNIRPPDFSEWHDYMGDFVIKWMTRGYIAFVFRGIDRFEILTQAENDALELDAEDRHDIAKPLAHIADRSKLGKKYGRVIIDSSDGATAMIHLGMWGSRVNRIAKIAHKRMNREGENEQSSGASGASVPATEFPPPAGVYTGNGTRAPGVGYN